MKSLTRSLPVYIAFLSAISAAVGAAHAADQLSDAQVQAREVLSPTRANHLMHSTQLAGVNRATGPIIDVQEQARRAILGTSSAATANTVDGNRSSQHASVQGDATPKFADAQVMARQVILGAPVDQSSKADRPSAALGSP
jgi:hypothetical protein